MGRVKFPSPQKRSSTRSPGWGSSSSNACSTIRTLSARLSGTPATYSAEDACAIIALACEDPCDSGWAITHWTQRKLAAEAIKRSARLGTF